MIYLHPTQQLTIRKTVATRTGTEDKTISQRHPSVGMTTDAIKISTVTPVAQKI